MKLKTIGQMIHDKELQPGQVLELENGKTLLVGHVNDCDEGETNCCLTEEILKGVKNVTLLPWDNEEGWGAPPKAGSETFQLDEEAQNLFSMLWFFGKLKAGDCVELDDGRKLFIGDINLLGGVCDAGTTTTGDEGNSELRVVRWKRLWEGNEE
jgi:hypothetical protein